MKSFLRSVLVALCGFLALVLNSPAAQAGGAPAEGDVKAAFEKMFQDRNADTNTVTFDTPLRTAPPIVGQVTPVIGIPVYPVKVNFTSAAGYPTRTIYTHWTGGLYHFYLDSFGDWHFITAEQATFKNESVAK